jgi:hypothetical protein
MDLPQPSETRSAKIRIISGIAAAGFVLAVLFHYLMGHRAGMPYPYNTFLFRPDDRFADFTHVHQYLRTVSMASPEMRQLFNYPPFAYVMLYPFTLLPPAVALPVYLLVFVAAFLYLSYRALRGSTWYVSVRNVLLISCLSYPFLFALDRANIETLIFLLVYWAADSYSRRQYLWSMVPLAVAAAMKIFPMVFVALPFADRKVRAGLFAVLLVIAFSILGLAVQGGSWTDQFMASVWSMRIYQRNYAIFDQGLAFGHSLWGALKGISQMLGEPLAVNDLLIRLYRVYPLIGLTILALTVGYIRWFETELWKKVALLVCAMNMLPYVSCDYKLLHLYTPLFLFVNAPTRGRLDWLYAIIFGLLLVPKAYAQWGPKGEIHESMILNPMLMTALCLAIVSSGLLRAVLSLHRRLTQRSAPAPAPES